MAFGLALGLPMLRAPGVASAPPVRKAAVVILAGQSLSSVRTSQPVLLSTAPNSYMPVGGPTFAQISAAYNDAMMGTPLASTVALSETVGQSPVAGVASTVVGGAFSRAYLFSIGQPGLPILNNIVKAGKLNMRAAVHRLCDAARADGYEPVVMYYLCTGEADSDAGTSIATFLDRSSKFVSAARLTAAQAMGNPNYVAPVFATYANQMWNGASDRTVKEALRQAGLNPGVYVLGPSYPYPVDNDRIHNTNIGMIYRGEFVGKAMREWFTDDTEPAALSITDLTLSGTTFVATFSEAIVRDATLNCGENLNTANAVDGLEWSDNGTDLAISSLTYGTNTITGTLSATPTGTTAQQVLRIAEQYTPGTALINYANVAGCIVRAATAGWASSYNPSYTHYRWAIPQSVTPRAV